MRALASCLLLLSLFVGAIVAFDVHEERAKKPINLVTIHDDSAAAGAKKLVATFPANATTTTSSTAKIPCYPIPKSFCVGCAFGCSDTCFYTGSYASCVVQCMSYPDWVPNTQVTITYFPYGQWSTGGCICHGYVCA